MIIGVKQSHIDAGLKMDCAKCPVALALREAFSDSDYCIVTDRFMSLYFGKRVVRYKTLDIVAAFIRVFDQGDAVQPFVFELGFPIYC